MSDLKEDDPTHGLAKRLILAGRRGESLDDLKDEQQTADAQPNTNASNEGSEA